MSDRETPGLETGDARATVTDDAATDRLMDVIDARGWVSMVTAWPLQRWASAVVAAGPDGAQRCYEAEADTEVEALSRAFHKARTAEDFAPAMAVEP